jgi:hypothetical protein
MVRKTPSAIVAIVVLLAAGAAWASHQLIGPSPGLSNGPTTTTAQASSATNATTPGVTSTTTTPIGSTGTTGPSTGVLGNGAVSGTGTTPTTTTPTATSGAATANALAIDQVVSFTRTVEAGAGAVNAFTVPAGQQLVVTDVFITNPGTTPICGASISPGGTTTPTTSGTTNGTTTTPGGATTTPTTIESGTGLLCVPAQTSLSLGLTTGLEFNAGQSVVLANAAPAATTTTPPATAGGALHYHLRGFLVSPTGA